MSLRARPSARSRVLRWAGIAGGAGALAIRPAIRLRRHAVRGDAPPAEVLFGFRQRMEAVGDDVVVADGDRLVARFAGEAGAFRYSTVELVSFLPDGVTFEHLRGPFEHCHEVFKVVPAAGGGSVVTHEGTVTMRKGLLGWLLGVTVVRRVFERHVAAHMETEFA